ncbi:MAG: putative multi-sensor signal transduction histidine kinase [Marmoricola sp.]|nr:putative multi-sensor signal transduction histidine kinase [Marmoricola sp.]
MIFLGNRQAEFLDTAPVAHPSPGAAPTTRTDEDVALHHLTSAAVALASVTIAWISLMDPRLRGLDSTSRGPGAPPQHVAPADTRWLCHRVVRAHGPLVVDDVRKKAVDAVLVGGVGSYAAFPLHDPAGVVVGALCVLSSRPRTWSAEMREALEALAVAADREIALRLENRRLEVSRAALQELLVSDRAAAVMTIDPAGVVTSLSVGAERALGIDAQAVVGRRSIDEIFHLDEAAVGSARRDTGGCVCVMARLGPSFPGTRRLELAYEGSGGSRCTLSASIMPLEDREARGYLVVVHQSPDLRHVQRPVEPGGGRPATRSAVLAYGDGPGHGEVA